MLLVKYLYVKTFFSIPYNQFCQVRGTKGNSRDSKSAPCWADSQSKGWDSSVVVCFPGAAWLSSVSLFVSSSSIDPSFSSITFSARCVQIWTLFGAEMWFSVFAWIKEEVTLIEQHQTVTHSLLCQKQNSTDKGNRNTLCRRWVPSLWKAELSSKWQNLSQIFLFQRPSAITLCRIETRGDCAGTYTQQSAHYWNFLHLLKELWFMIQGGLSVRLWWLSCPGGKCWMGAVPSLQSKIHWHLGRFLACAKLEFVLVQQLLYKELSYSCKGAQQTAGWWKQYSYSKVNCLYLGIRGLREWKVLMGVIIVNWMTENVSVTWLCVICCCLSSL